MADAPDVMNLEMRIVELENRLKELQSGGQPEEIRPEDIKSFQKVARALGISIDPSCGINECMSCVISRCQSCARCGGACLCTGPNSCGCSGCIVCGCVCACVGGFGRASGGGGRFGGLGEE